MSSERIVERTRTAIQRDRLSRFLKESNQQSSGCFYYSLLTAWENLSSGEILPRNISEQILSQDKKLGVRPADAVQKINDLESILHLSVSEIELTIANLTSVDDFKRETGFGDSIPVSKGTTDQILSRNDRSSAIIFWQHENLESGHYTSLHESTTFQGIEMKRGNLGGQPGADFVGKHGYVPLVVFHLSKSN